MFILTTMVIIYLSSYWPVPMMSVKKFQLAGLIPLGPIFPNGRIVNELLSLPGKMLLMILATFITEKLRFVNMMIIMETGF